MSVVDRVAENIGSPSPAPQRATLEPLRQHRLFIIVFVTSALMSALVLTYIYSERYRAETTIFFKSSDVRRLNNHNSTMALGSPLPPTVPFKVVTQTINGLVGSDQLLRRVVTELHLDASEPKDYSGPWYISYYKQLKDWLSDYASDLWQIVRFGRIIEQDPVSRAISDLRKEIKIRNDDSYIYTLQVTTKSPARAVAIADAVGADLIDLTHRNEHLPAQEEIAKLTGLRDGKLREIEGLQDRMRDLLAGIQVASIKEEVDKITALSSQLNQERFNTSADLRQSEAKLARLSEKLTLPVSSAGIAESDAVTARRPHRLTPDDYAKLTSEKHVAEVNSASLRARLGALDQSIATVTNRLQRLNQTQAEHELLSAQLNSAKRDYAALTDAYQELVIRTASGQSELRILAKATMPDLPVSPIKIYHTAAAGFVAALLAIGLVFVLDFFQIRVFLPRAGGRRRRLAPIRPEAPDGPHSVAAD